MFLQASTYHGQDYATRMDGIEHWTFLTVELCTCTNANTHTAHMYTHASIHTHIHMQKLNT